MNRSWLYIVIGAVFEVVWVIGFKHADDYLSWIGTIAAVVISFAFIITATGKLPVGTVYAVFTGLGTAGTVLSEMILFHEPVEWIKLLLIAMLLAGVLGLKLVGGSVETKEASS